MGRHIRNGNKHIPLKCVRACVRVFYWNLLEFEPRPSHMLDKNYYHWAMSPALKYKFKATFLILVSTLFASSPHSSEESPHLRVKLLVNNKYLETAVEIQTSECFHLREISTVGLGDIGCHICAPLRLEIL